MSLDEGGYLSQAAWKRITDTATKTLTQFHKRNPYKALMPYGDLRAALQKAATVASGDALFSELATQNVLAREPSGARLPDFALVLPPKWEDAAREIVPVFVAGGLTDPPWPGNFRPHYPRDVPIDALLSVLCERGELIALAPPDLFVAASAVDAAITVLRELSAKGVPLSIGTVRDATGSSRRVVVPLLEYLDRTGFTVRDGDVRTLKVG